MRSERYKDDRAGCAILAASGMGHRLQDRADTGCVGTNGYRGIPRQRRALLTVLAVRGVLDLAVSPESASRLLRTPKVSRTRDTGKPLMPARRAG